MNEELKTIKIGSRGSPLALAQVAMVERALARACPAIQTQRVIITTSGDWKPEHGEVKLSEKAGGKAQFAKEIEEALLAGAIDMAVHSMKDMDSHLPDGLTIDHMLPREDVRDCLLLSDEIAADKHVQGVESLPIDAVIGTVSARRAAFILSQRPDINITPLRGNVQTRIDKVRSGQVDITLLALAGLKRLGIAEAANIILPVDVMLPAAGQGAVGIEICDGNDELANAISQISDVKTVFCVKAERAALRALDGSCHSPIGAYAQVNDAGELWLRVCVAMPDGAQVFHDEIRCDVKDIADCVAIGDAIGSRMKALIPAGILG